MEDWCPTGFVFATIHHIQGGVPPANLRAVFDTLRELRESVTVR